MPDIEGHNPSDEVKDQDSNAWKVDAVSSNVTSGRVQGQDTALDSRAFPLVFRQDRTTSYVNDHSLVALSLASRYSETNFE